VAADGTIGIVLLIACANVANLLLVRAEGRGGLTVRAALGAGWGHITRHLLTESVTLGVLRRPGLALAYAGLQLLVAIGPAQLPRLSEMSIDSRVLAFTLAVSVISALLFGLIPVVKYAAPRRSLALGAAAGGRAVGESRTRQRSQNTLLVVQVGLAVVLLVASGLMIRTFQALRRVQPGFTAPAQVQTLRLSIPQTDVPEAERVVRMQQDILDRLAALPDVTSVAFASSLPMEFEFENNVAVTAEGQTVAEGIPPMRRSKNVAPGFFKTLQIPLTAGRDFTWTDVYDRRPVVIVSQNMAREVWGEASAAQQANQHQAPECVGEVIRVVGDVHDSGVISRRRRPYTGVRASRAASAAPAFIKGVRAPAHPAGQGARRTDGLTVWRQQKSACRASRH
jgi:hypothetical protein